MIFIKIVFSHPKANNEAMYVLISVPSGLQKCTVSMKNLKYFAGIHKTGPLKK